MPTFKPGDRVRVVKRAVTADDRAHNRYFDHMAGLVGTVQQVYSEQEVAVEVDVNSLTPVSKDVQKTATERMREKFMAQASEEQKKAFTKEELEFDAHYVVLVQNKDLEKE